jgi:hypothetical protein
VSWLFSRALAAEYSEESCLDGAPFAQSSKTPTPQAYLWHDKTTDALSLSQFGMTFVRLTEDHGKDVLTWFLEASHVKTLAPLVKELEYQDSAADYGKKWHALSARFDQASHSWKTHRCLFLEDLEWSSVTFPPWGMIRDGELLELITLVLPTGEIEFGYSLPTPTANEGGRQRSKSSGAKIRPSLGMMARKQLWPIPTATANQLSPSMQKWPAHQALSEQVGGSWNPAWVEWLMGWPIGWTDLKPLGTVKSPSALPQPGDS